MIKEWLRKLRRGNPERGYGRSQKSEGNDNDIDDVRRRQKVVELQLRQIEATIHRRNRL